jgi:hypothetical protein
MEQIACERNWSYEMIEKDLEILEKNRLFTVSDLRVLSKYSWKVKILYYCLVKSNLLFRILSYCPLLKI